MTWCRSAAWPWSWRSPAPGTMRPVFWPRTNWLPWPAREWGGPLPRLLLKALIARGSQAVPKDVIMEDLWPEAAPAEAENKFKSCLHRLRKALEPDLDRIVGSSFVHLEA